MKSISFITLDTDYPIADFAAERNKLLKKAKTEWVFFVDSDEEVSPELEQEIHKAINDSGPGQNDGLRNGYFIKRKDFFWGKWLRFGETGNIKLLRLGRKNAGKWQRKVHEYWDIKNAGILRSPLLHYPHPTIFAFINSINHYTSIDAREFGHFSYWEVLVKPAGKFVQNYILRLGFLDGFAGFVHAYMMAFQSLVTRVKQYDFFATS